MHYPSSVDIEIKETRELHKGAWKFLNLLTTPNGAKYRLQESGRSLGSIKERANTLSVVVNAAREAYEDYLYSRSIISLYYMSFKLIQALLVSTSPTIFNLQQLQNSSRFGHGIKMNLQDGRHFPKGVNFWYTKTGMFSDVIRTCEWDDTFIKPDSQNEVDKLLKKNDKAILEESHIYNASNLLNRIPELRTYLFELNIGKPYYFRTSQGEAGIANPGAYVNIDTEEWRHNSLPSIKRFLNRFNRPEAAYNERMANLLKFSPFPGKVFHYQVQIETPLYNYWVIKLETIDNMLAIHFTLLYILSILARYYPLEWSRMTSGKQSNFPLIDAFSEYTLNGITTWVCNKIFGKMIVA